MGCLILVENCVECVGVLFSSLFFFFSIVLTKNVEELIACPSHKFITVNLGCRNCWNTSAMY